MEEMEENELRKAGNAKEIFYDNIPKALIFAAKQFEHCHGERSIFMHALMRLMLDTGTYDVIVGGDDSISMEGHSIFVSKDEDRFKVSIVFPDQSLSTLVED